MGRPGDLGVGITPPPRERCRPSAVPPGRPGGTSRNGSVGPTAGRRAVTGQTVKRDHTSGVPWNGRPEGEAHPVAALAPGRSYRRASARNLCWAEDEADGAREGPRDSAKGTWDPRPAPAEAMRVGAETRGRSWTTARRGLPGRLTPKDRDRCYAPPQVNRRDQRRSGTAHLVNNGPGGSYTITR